MGTQELKIIHVGGGGEGPYKSCHQSFGGLSSWYQVDVSPSS